MGNPPFLGISLRSASQTAELQEVWGQRYHGTLDYVTGWHAVAREYFGEIAGRWALVTTSSVTQGEVVAPLFRPILSAGWQIYSPTEYSSGRQRRQVRRPFTA